MSNEKKEYLKKTICLFLIAIVTYFIVYKQMFIPHTDYYVHMNLALDITKKIPFQQSYPLWHLIAWFFYKIGFLLIKMPVEVACSFVTAAVNCCIYLCIEHILAKRSILNSSIIAFGLCFVMPLYIPWFNSFIYKGNGSPTTWHNPTNMMVKPFAIMSFSLLIYMFDNIRKGINNEKKNYVCLMLLVLGSVIAKPSYFQGVAPALALFVLISLLTDKGHVFKEYFKLCSCFIPGFLVIIFQFVLSFYSGEKGSGIGIGWLEVAKATTPNVYISLFLVLAFPLVYTVCNIRKKVRQVGYQLGWLYVVVAWLEWALLFENGERKYHGNFGWAAQLAYTIIWIITTTDFFGDWQEMDLKNNKEKCKNTILLFIWLIHLIVGIYYVKILLIVQDIWY